MSLDQLFANSSINVPEMLEILRKTAAALGLAFGQRTNTYNSRLAQELGHWAETKGKGEEFHIAAFLAYFAEGKNLAEENTLLEITKNLGFDESEVQPILQNRRYKASVDSDWELSREWGITAVPTFVLGGQTLVGAQPYEELEKMVRSNNVPKI
jgi:predicted DsbA family dithiol-disulfide isomerase